jgi:hypothetical protein
MKTFSLRAAAREFHVDRATLAKVVAERSVRPVGHRAGHAVFDRDDLRRVVGLEFYGSAAAILPTCDECWGPLARHKGGKPCKPGSYDRNPRAFGAAE